MVSNAKPRAFTLRESGRRAEWMARLLATTRETTKAKAVWLAIRRHPGLAAEVERLGRDLAGARRQTEAAEAELERVRRAVGVLVESAGVAGPGAAAAASAAVEPTGVGAEATLRGRATRRDAEHFRRLGEEIAAHPSDEGPPANLRQLLARMCRMDPQKCGWGTEDPQGGDWVDHLAYLEARQRVIDGRPDEREHGGPA